MIAATQGARNDLDALPPLPRKVWYTSETGAHIPVAPEMRKVALKKLDDKRKARSLTCCFASLCGAARLQAYATAKEGLVGNVASEIENGSAKGTEKDRQGQHR